MFLSLFFSLPPHTLPILNSRLFSESVEHWAPLLSHLCVNAYLHSVYLCLYVLFVFWFCVCIKHNNSGLASSKCVLRKNRVVCIFILSHIYRMLVRHQREREIYIPTHARWSLPFNKNPTLTIKNTISIQLIVKGKN